MEANSLWLDRDAELDPGPRLTVKQRKILAYNASGLTLQQVALEMHISNANVYNTVQEIKDMTGCRTLAACALFAHALGFLVHASGDNMTVLPVGV